MLNYGFNPYQQQFIQPQTQPQIKAISVTNKSEANSVIPDTTGIPTLFWNKGADEIYLKQFDITTGLGIFKEYVLKQPEQTEQHEEVTPQKNYDEDFKILGNKLDEIKAVIEKEKKNAK